MYVRINVLKNTMLLLCAVLLMITCFFLTYLLAPNRAVSVALYLILLICFTRIIINIIWDYKTWLFLSKESLELQRRGKRTIVLWGEINRIEYSGVKRCRLFDVLIIHTNGDIIYLEYTFDKYREVWDAIRQELSQNMYSATIDENVPNDQQHR